MTERKVTLFKSQDWDTWISYVRMLTITSQTWELIDSSLSEKPSYLTKFIKSVMFVQVTNETYTQYKMLSLKHKQNQIKFEKQQASFKKNNQIYSSNDLVWKCYSYRKYKDTFMKSSNCFERKNNIFRRRTIILYRKEISQAMRRITRSKRRKVNKSVNKMLQKSEEIWNHENSNEQIYSKFLARSQTNRFIFFRISFHSNEKDDFEYIRNHKELQTQRSYVEKC